MRGTERDSLEASRHSRGRRLDQNGGIRFPGAEGQTAADLYHVAELRSIRAATKGNLRIALDRVAVVGIGVIAEANDRQQREAVTLVRPGVTGFPLKANSSRFGTPLRLKSARGAVCGPLKEGPNCCAQAATVGRVVVQGDRRRRSLRNRVAAAGNDRSHDAFIELGELVVRQRCDRNQTERLVRRESDGGGIASERDIERVIDTGSGAAVETQVDADRLGWGSPRRTASVAVSRGRSEAEASLVETAACGGGKVPLMARAILPCAPSQPSTAI